MRTGAVLVTMLSLLIVALLPYRASADVANARQRIQQMQQEQTARREHMLVRPTPQEREAIRTLINMNPRPKTFTEADVNYLKGLLDKATWMGGEQRIMHEMWMEATGKPWGASDGNTSKQPEATQ